jgi:class 3 adenylate cyclase/tetratricopeptide (TPR) repeat protein
VVAPRGERKHVSILFADLTGYTRLAASLDPEEVYTFLRPTMRELQEIVEEFGGTVPQVMGDGFMAVFGVPVAHEDDAERAVRAAIALRDHVHRLNADGPHVRFPDVHAGVNSGEVMVAPADEQAGFRVVGDTVNVASRLADLATPGRILVDRHTVDLTSHAISYGPRRRRRVKGLEQSLPTYEALTAQTLAHRARRPKEAWPFVDRHAEIARLEVELRNATRTRRSRVDVVSGEPGLGKSRLAEEFARRVQIATVLSGRCRPFGRRRPLDALAEALSGAIVPSGSRDRDKIRTAIERVAVRVADAQERAAVVRNIGILLGIERPGNRRPDPIEPLLRAVRTIVEDLARKRPVVFIIDDLHWADPELLDAIEDIYASPWRGPILVLGLSRPEGFGRTLPAIELSALDEGHSSVLAREVLGSDLRPDLLRSLVVRSGGNPLFLEESVGMLVESGAIALEGGRWTVRRPHEVERVPSTIRRLIAARLDGLPTAEKRLVQDAAVVGDAVWEVLLDDLLEGAKSRPLLRSLEARDLLRRRRRSGLPGSSEYGFKHVLIREVAYESLPKAERARKHLEIARWLSEDAPHEDPAMVAHHYESAWLLLRTRTGPPPPADVSSLTVRALRRHAEESFAYQARATEALYARALRVADAAGSGVEDAERARLLVGRSEALEEMGRRRGAIEHAISAHELARRSGDRALEARALMAQGLSERSRPLLQRALALFQECGDVGGQGWAHLRISDTWADEDYRQELEELRLAYELLTTAGQTVGQSLVAQDLAFLLTVVGGREYRRWFGESRRLATKEGDLRSRSGLLRTSGYFEHYRGRHVEAIRLMQQARPIAVEAGDRYAEADTLVIEAMATAHIGTQKRAQQLAEAAIMMGHEMEADRVVALGMLAGARSAARSGRPAAATRRLRSAVKLLQPPTRLDILDAHLVTAQIHLDRGSLQEVGRAADELRSGVVANGWRLWEPLAPLLTGRARLEAGETSQALADLDSAVGAARSAGATGTLLLARAARDQAMIMSGREPRPASRSVAATGELAAVDAENRGLLELRSHRPDAAAVAFHEAVERWRELGVTAWLARALAMQAHAERRAGNRRRAPRLMSKAEEVLDALNTPAAARALLLRPLETAHMA